MRERRKQRLFLILKAYKHSYPSVLKLCRIFRVSEPQLRIDLEFLKARHPDKIPMTIRRREIPVYKEIKEEVLVW